MATRIAIASGKGGTGKTTFALHFFNFLVCKVPGKVLLVDCDVEEPNTVIFFPGAEMVQETSVKQEVPVIDTTRCNFCRKCVEYCEFNAITVLPPADFAEIDEKLCHSCGACMVACDQDAIWVKHVPIGSIRKYRTRSGLYILEGELKIGSAMQTMVIRSLKKVIPGGYDLILLDAPPGTSCPVVETISDADYVVLVTEPTPFGFHDMKLMVKLLRDMGKPFGVVVNKAGIGNQDVFQYMEREGITILGKIPFSRSFASQYARAELFHEVPEEIRSAYEDLALKLTSEVVDP